MKNFIYKTRLRPKGQITVPTEIRNLLGVEEGDDLIFTAEANGRIMISRVLEVPPEQAWFWQERWQRMEREAEADIESGQVKDYHDLTSAIDGLTSLIQKPDAED